MVDLTDGQKAVIAANEYQLVTGGPGSGKTTVSILKSAQIARESLGPAQKVLFLSFARATVSRVVEAIKEERQLTREERARIEVDTYHAFFWRILKAHGYLVGLPRRMTILTPPNEAIALSDLRSAYKPDKNLTDFEKEEKRAAEHQERLRLARDEGKVCFSLFAELVGQLLHGAKKIRGLVSLMYPYIILDEFQDTSGDQWHVVKALGEGSTLLALADPDQRIFDFIGADPKRLDHFKEAFGPTVTDLAGDNHRSGGTEIALFGNDILTGTFTKQNYNGIHRKTFPSNHEQAYAALVGEVLQGRKRLLDAGKQGWALAVLVPTRRMTRLITDVFREPFGGLPPISHTAAVDMHGPVLAAEVVAFCLQQVPGAEGFNALVDLVCGFFRGKGGDTPTKGGIEVGKKCLAALEKWNANLAKGKAPPGNSMITNMAAAYEAAVALKLTGDPDADWRTMRALLESGDCDRLNEVAKEVRNVRLLERGTELRQGLAQDWRDNGAYRNALRITRQAFMTEHFSSAVRPESGVVVMNMHKAKGKQFDEVIIFEGHPRRFKGVIEANPDRIVGGNVRRADMSQERQNFRVSVTRAKQRTTIMTPGDDICVLLKPNA